MIFHLVRIDSLILRVTVASEKLYPILLGFL